MEYIIVGFDGNEFSGEIATELAKVIESGLVRLLDVIFISCGEDGSVVTMEVDEHDGLRFFADLEGEVGGIIGPDDIEHAAAAIQGGQSVLLIVWENLWAAPLADAITAAGGTLIEGARIPDDLATEARELLASAG
ncbi:MAG: DUF6325 family protein [Ilumatobacteraceae bacterium]